LGARHAAFAPDGKTLTVNDGNGRNYLWNVWANTVIAASDSTGIQGNHSGGAVLSPDGAAVANSVFLNGTELPFDLRLGHRLLALCPV
jgi:hypothetical protein